MGSSRDSRALLSIIFVSLLGLAAGSLLAGFSSAVVSQQILLLICSPILLVSLLVFTFFSKEVDRGASVYGFAVICVIKNL